jgi:hypothetical protein
VNRGLARNQPEQLRYESLRFIAVFVVARAVFVTAQPVFTQVIELLGCEAQQRWFKPYDSTTRQHGPRSRERDALGELGDGFYG